MRLSAKIFQCITVLCCLIVFLFSGFSQNTNIKTVSTPEDTIFDDVEIKEGKLYYKSYKFSNVEFIDLSDLDIWDKTPPKNPVSYFVAGDPTAEFKKLLLIKGLAKIKVEANAEGNLLSAQNDAKQKSVGLWKEIKEQESQETKGKTPQPSPTVEQESFNFEPIYNFLYSLIGYVFKILIWLLPLGGLIALVKVLFDYFKKRKLFLVILGSRSSGKTTIYKRMFHPSTKPEECGKPKTTMKTGVFAANEQHSWGNYVVRPMYVDTAGGKFGEQASEMMKRDTFFTKLFRKNKYVWIIALATTDDSLVKRIDPENKKINNGFIERQLGYLSLPIAFLTGKQKTLLGFDNSMTKPDMVIVCINKSDLFSENQDDAQSRGKLENLFQEHISLLKSTCKDTKTKFFFHIVSACEGWHTSLVRDTVERELYSRKK